VSAAACERWRDAAPTGASDGAPWRSHLESCPTCAARAPLSAAERARLRGGAEARFDQLTLRRLRQRVLDDARRPRRAPRRRVPGAARSSALALVAFSVICGWPAARGKPATPSVVTAEGAGAQWSRLVDGDVEVLALRRGAFGVNVQNHEPGRIFVRLPDGELRDFGTIFRVVVDGARTEEVSVAEGRVAIAVRDLPPALLVAGDLWRRPAPEIVPPLAAPPPAVRRIPANAPARAASGLGAEDAAYLRVLELVRAGRQADARSEARRYLRRFPDGFRRDEMGAMASSSP
jgi:hypothetical protein